jgi:hypothetical protein
MLYIYVRVYLYMCIYIDQIYPLTVVRKLLVFVTVSPINMNVEVPTLYVD